MTSLRLVGRPLLSVEHLAQFDTPKTWPEILALEPKLHRMRWLDGVLDCDEWGLGLLQWLPGESRRTRPVRLGAWVLTDAGRAYVARKRRRAA